MSRSRSDEASKGVNDSSNLGSIARTTGLEMVYTTDIVELIQHDLLMKMAGKSDELDAKIEKAYKTLFPKGRFKPDSFAVEGTLLLGPPGQGKTSVLREASRRNAQLLGMRFLDNPPEDIEITPDDFVFMSLEFAGVNSSIQIRGIPFKCEFENSQGQTEKFLSFLKDRALSSLSNAGGAMLNLDDIMNGSAAMINVALPLFEEGRYSGLHLKNILVCGTGNLGSLDGTKTSDISSALRGRARILLARDNYMDLSKRIRKTYGVDDVGDGFFANFIERKGAALLDTLPTNGQRGGYPASRNLDKACRAWRREINRAGGPEHALEALENFAVSVGAYVGPECSHEMKAFLHSAYNSADPIARKIILTGVKDDRLDKYVNTPTSQEAATFFIQFASALADWTAVRISQDKNPTGPIFDETVKRFFDGAFLMDGASLVSSLELFRENLLNRIPQLGTQAGEGKTAIKLFTNDVIDRLVPIVTKHPGYNEYHKNDVASILSGISAIAGSPNVSATPTRKRGSSKAAAGQ